MRTKIPIVRDDFGKFVSASKIYFAINDLRDDFYCRVAVAGENECWLWTAARTGMDYGQYCFDHKVIYAHRFSWMLEYGEIPKGINILHSCDNPPCVNPRHLEAGTQRKNMLDKVARGRDNSPFGEAAGMSKLTEKEVLEIRFLYSTGNYTQRELGRMFDISNRNVSSIVTFETWRHI